GAARAAGGAARAGDPAAPGGCRRDRAVRRRAVRGPPDLVGAVRAVPARSRADRGARGSVATRGDRGRPPGVFGDRGAAVGVAGGVAGGSVVPPVELEALLRDHGCSITAPRRAILRFLADNPTHPTAAQVYDAVTRDDPQASRATVYNTLALLTEL